MNNQFKLSERLLAYVHAFASNTEGLVLTPDIWNNLRSDIKEAADKLSGDGGSP